MELSVFAAVAMMIAAALIKGFTTKSLTQMRQEGGRLHSEESRTRQDLQQAQVVLESAEALHNQAGFDCQKLSEELVDLEKEQEQVAADLGRSEAEQETED